MDRGSGIARSTGEAVEATVLPTLAPLGELEAYYSHLISDREGYCEYRYDLRPYVRVVVEAARGRLDEVRAICRDELPKWPDNWFGGSPEAVEIMRRAKSACPLAEAVDRAGIARLLHAWEAATIRNLRIEPLREPTPFPIEQGSPEC